MPRSNYTYYTSIGVTMSKGNRKRRRELGILEAPVLCSARSSRTGLPCRRSPIKGGNVCTTHGGSAPATVAAARRRLMAASDRVGALLLRIAEDEATPPPVRLAAIRDVLDRAGVTVKQEVEVTVQPWQQLVDGIVAEVADDAVRPRSAYLDGLLEGEVVDEVTPRRAPAALPAAPAPTPTVPNDGVRIPSRRKRGSGLDGR